MKCATTLKYAVRIDVNYKNNDMKNDLAGKRFGRWIVVSESEKRTKSRYVYWVCKCDCGTIKDIASNNLLNGVTTSCGCLRKERLTVRNKTHNGSKTRLYSIWSSMIQRCTNPNNKDFKEYGGRGVSVCEEWRNFEAFLNDMGECPIGMSIDRIDVNGNYEPCNCRWATDEQQSRNRRSVRNIEFNGETKLLSDWAKQYGISRTTLADRLNRGWNIETALTTQTKDRRKI